MHELDEIWWEGLAAELLPQSQRAVIKTLEAAGTPLSEAALLEALGEKRQLGPRIKHHLSRLRSLNAIDIEVSETGADRVRYRLTERPGHEHGPSGPQISPKRG